VTKLDKLLEIKNVKKYFQVKGERSGHNICRAVDDVTFDILKGETLGLVGESGSGKTTVGRTILRLYEPTAGTIAYAGKDITTADIKPYRRKMQYIFQDPYASLNPRLTVGDIIGEPIDIHQLAQNKQERKERIFELLNQVGLNNEHASRYPHEFSGGQRQRIGIARALAVQPEFIVCDEPVSALDVSIQAQIINMLESLQQKMGLTYLFIAHDLAVVKHLSQRIGVMYLGKVVELNNTADLHDRPAHPYTRALLSAVPVFSQNIHQKKKRIILEGEIPSPMNPPKGCVFSTRCSYAREICRQQTPELVEMEPGHHVACHLMGEI